MRTACLTLLLCVRALPAADPESMPLPRHILTNEGLVVLAKAGIGDSLIVDLIRFKRTQFDTSADALALLARHGMSENVIRAVVEKQEQLRMPKPRLSLSETLPGNIEIDPGDVLMMPTQNGKKPKHDPNRWYKISLR